MNEELLAVILTAVVSVVTTLVASLYGPAWKDRLDARRTARQRSDQVISQYSEPLARAAYDLQSRIYNISQQGLMRAASIPADYRRLSTLWILGQFLAWIEIVRREVQVIDFGDVHRTSRLQHHLFAVVAVLASDATPADDFRVFRADQRAIGELMVVERTIGGQQRSDSLGYGDFVRRMESDPAFARWFADLDASVGRLVRGGPLGTRLVRIQRELIDLLDFIDPDAIRFPDRSTRTKLPLPARVPPPSRRHDASDRLA